MNWLSRARREIAGIAERPTANTAERNPTTVTAVPRLGPLASIGSNDSERLAGFDETEALRHAFEERAAILEYDGGLSREDAEREAWALVTDPRRLH